MVRAIALIVIVAIIVLAGLAWFMFTQVSKSRAREQARLDQLQTQLHEVDSLLYSYTPSDPMGDSLERQAREIFVRYNTMLSLSSTRKRYLDAAQTAHSRLTLLFSEHPQSLFAPGDDVSKTFVREVFHALHPTQPKVTPHVP
jgi:hypothetical protein